MRRLEIKSNKSERNRLCMMESDLGRLLPFDTETIAPFGYRTTAGRTLLTYKDHDIAVVPAAMNADGKSFDLEVLIPPSDVVDNALRTVIARLTAHMNQVNKMNNQLIKEDRAKKELEYNEQDAIYKELRQRYMTVAQSFFDATAFKDQHCEGVSAQDLEAASRLSQKVTDCQISRQYIGLDQTYALSFHTLSNVRIIFGAHEGLYVPHDDYTITASYDEYGRALIAHVAGKDFDKRRACALIQDMAAMSRRVYDLADLNRALGTLDDLPYDPISLLLNPVQDMDVQTYPLTGVFSLKIRYQTMHVMREGCEILNVSRPYPDYTGPVDLHAYRVTNVDGQPESTISYDNFGKLINVWIEAIRHADPAKDMRPYRRVDIASLERDADTIDVGYGF